MPRGALDSALPPAISSSHHPVTNLFIGTVPPPSSSSSTSCWFPIKLMLAENAPLLPSLPLIIERDASKRGLTGIVIYFPGRGEFAPPGYVDCEGGGNSGADGDVMRIAISRHMEEGACPIVNVGICSSSSCAATAPWTLLDRSPMGFNTSLTQGTAPGSSMYVCVKYNVKELQRFNASSLLQCKEEAEAEEPIKPLRRKTSLLDVLSPSRTASVKSTSSFSQHGAAATTAQDDLSPLQLARERALQRTGCGEGLGLNGLAFDPEVAGLLMVDKDAMATCAQSLLQLTRGTTQEAVTAMNDLTKLMMDSSSELRPSAPLSEQMTMFDFGIAYGAAGACLERGADVLIEPACRFVMQGSKLATAGWHPVSLHYSLRLLLHAKTFAKRMASVFAPKQAELVAPKDPSSSFKKRLLYNSSSTSSSSPASTTSSPTKLLASGKAAFSSSNGHFIPREGLDTWAHVVDELQNALLGDLFARSSSSSSSTVDAAQNGAMCGDVNEALDRIADLIAHGSFTPTLETGLRIHLHLISLFDNQSSPLTDLLFALVWLFANSVATTTMDCDERDASFELLLDFLPQAASATVMSEPVALIVRRLLFPLLLKLYSNLAVINAQHCRLITCLWTHYRKELKAEFVILFHVVITPALSNSAAAASEPVLALLRMLDEWFASSPLVLLELYFNLDLALIPNWNRFQDLMASLCDLALAPSSAHSFATSSNSTSGSTRHSFSNSYHRHSQLFSSFQRPRPRLFEEDEEDLAARASSSTPRFYALSILVSISRHLANLCGTLALNKPEWQANAQANEPKHERFTVLQRALDLGRNARSNGDSGGGNGVRDAVNFLLASGHLENAPLAVCRFLRLYQADLGEASIGQFLGEGGKTLQDEALMSNVRDVYVSSALLCNRSDTLDQALRAFLTQSGFVLPGEAQKIERLLEAFAKRFAADHDADLGLSAESILFLSFALVMLNTDLHKPQIKRAQKMTREDFIRNLRGGNAGHTDFDRTLLEQLYDSIQANPIQFDTTVQDSTKTPLQQQASCTLEQGLSILRSVRDEHVLFHSGEDITSDCARSIFAMLATRMFQIANNVLVVNETSTWLRDQALFFKALKLVEHALTVTFFLSNVAGEEGAAERRAFAAMLNKLQPDQPLFDQVVTYKLHEDTVGELLTRVHEWIRRVESKYSTWSDHQKLAKLAKRLNYPQLCNSNARHHVFKGEACLVARNSSSTELDCSLFLLSDCLLVCNTKLGVVEQDLPLKTIRVFAGEEGEEMFEVSSVTLANSLHFRVKSRHERDVWQGVLTQAIIQCNNKTSSVPANEALRDEVISEPSSAGKPRCLPPFNVGALIQRVLSRLLPSQCGGAKV